VNTQHNAQRTCMPACIMYRLPVICYCISRAVKIGPWSSHVHRKAHRLHVPSLADRSSIAPGLDDADRTQCAHSEEMSHWRPCCTLFWVATDPFRCRQYPKGTRYPSLTSRCGYSDAYAVRIGRLQGVCLKPAGSPSQGFGNQVGRCRGIVGRLSVDSGRL
jgi:hypothetical protein